MPKINLVSEETSIVLVGSFNPAIFHPSWLVGNGLLPKDDQEDSEIEIVHPQISKFRIAWLSLDIITNKFTSRTNDPSKYAPLRDLIISTFTLLSHTPIKQMGMNMILRYEAASEEDWHHIGDTFVPKTIWNKYLPSRVGMNALAISCPRQDDLDGHIKLVFEPYNHGRFGISVNVNGHVEISDDSGALVNDKGINEILGEYWESSIRFAKENVGNILSEALG